MSSKINLTKAITLHHNYRMQFEAAQQAHVLLYPEGMVKLNPSAAEILLLCDGKKNAKEIADELSKRFDDNTLSHDVFDFLGDAYERGWIEQ